MYLMRGMAALAMGLVVVSCNKMDFSGQPQVSTEEAMANAEMQLGVTIDPNQDWNMTQNVQANISVNMGTGKDYTLIVYDKNRRDRAACHQRWQVGNKTNMVEKWNIRQYGQRCPDGIGWCFILRPSERYLPQTGT